MMRWDILFNASREGRVFEIVLWANAIASLEMGAGAYYLFHSVILAVAVPVVLFLLLRAAITNRHTVWLAASFGTLGVSALGGGLAWLFGHVIESSPSAPAIASVITSVACATGPAWAYGRIAQRRESGGVDSLLTRASVPSSS